MSDDDRDVDVDVESDAEKRAHHNALERKRRDHIKESFHNLRDSVPSLQGEKVRNASRAQILKQATDYIQFMTKKNCNIQTDIDDLRKQNNMLEQQVKVLEKAKTTGSYIAQSKANPRSADSTSSLGDNSSDSDSSDSEQPTTRRKRIKVEKQ